MPSVSSVTGHRLRDDWLYSALAITPLTAKQIWKLSQTWPVPFLDVRRVRERLQVLAGAGRVRCHRYAPHADGRLHYYTLTAESYRHLHGPDTPLPSRQVFGPIAFSRERHTLLLAEVLVHFLVRAHEDGFTIRTVSGDGGTPIETGGRRFVPDGTVELVTPSGRLFRFYLELDNRTEPVRSLADRTSLTAKVHDYETYADRSDQRFRMLFVTSGGVARVRHFLDLAREMAANPDRSLFYGITFQGFLDLPSLRCRHLLDHRGERVALIEERSVGTALRLISEPVLVKV